MDMMQRLYLMLPWAPWVFIVSVSITVCIVIPLIKVKSLTISLSLLSVVSPVTLYYISFTLNITNLLTVFSLIT